MIPVRSSYLETKSDLVIGFQKAPIWILFSWHDVRQRYQRSVLGPFWFTLSSLFMMLLLGFLYSQILQISFRDYLPYLGVGLILWQYISAVLNEACSVLVSHAGIIKQTNMPFSFYSLRMVTRNLIILCHSIPVLIIIILIFDLPISFDVFYVVIGLLLLWLNGVWLSILVSIISTRFRDFVPIVSTLTMALFFITPVMWRVDQLGSRAWVAHYNPVAHIIDTVRVPLLGEGVPYNSLIISFALAIVGTLLAAVVLDRFRSKLAYWL